MTVINDTYTFNVFWNVYIQFKECGTLDPRLIGLLYLDFGAKVLKWHLFTWKASTQQFCFFQFYNCKGVKKSFKLYTPKNIISAIIIPWDMFQEGVDWRPARNPNYGYFASIFKNFPAILGKFTLKWSTQLLQTIDSLLFLSLPKCWEQKHTNICDFINILFSTLSLKVA